MPVEFKNYYDDGFTAPKRKIITKTYGFVPDSWEARTTPKQEN
jgi:hypothetical protein